jgi:hypothetical protein
MWRSVLLHEFPSEDIRSLQALPGSLTPGTLALNPHEGKVQITPGRGFRYVLGAPLRDVIGVSCRIRVRYPIQGVLHPVSLVRVGEDVEFAVRPLPFDAGSHPDELAGEARSLLRIGSAEVDLGLVVLPHRRFVELRLDWHTSGQAYLRADGHLVAYHNAVAPAARFEVDDVAFGLPNAPTSATNPRYEIARLFVRALSRPDALAALSRKLPAIDIPDDDLFERCRLRIMVDLMAKLDRLRAFMTQVNGTLSQPWSEDAQPNEEPFAEEAIRAHDLASAAVTELWKMLRSGDFTAPNRFLTPFTQFLEILHHALPVEFEQLASELEESTTVPDECRKVVDDAFARGRHDLAPLLALLTTASERVSEIAQGG